MAAWVCTACTTVYHVDSPSCPACGGIDHYEQGAEPMPKNNRTGSSHAAAGIGPTPTAEEVLDAELVDEAATGPEDAPSDAGSDPGTDTATSAPDATEAPVETLARPTVTGTREAWAVYAQTAHGIDPTGLTRQALIDAVTDAEAAAE